MTEAGRVFQRIEQEGRKEDRWAEVEHKGTSIDFGFRRLYLQREDAEESFSCRQGGPSPFLLQTGRRRMSTSPNIFLHQSLGDIGGRGEGRNSNGLLPILRILEHRYKEVRLLRE